MGSPQVYACVQVLAAFLLFELSKGPASFWFPYLDSLPHTYTSLSWFSPQEAEQLQVQSHFTDECGRLLLMSMASAENTSAVSLSTLR